MNVANVRYCSVPLRLLDTGLMPLESGRSTELAELPLVTFAGRPSLNHTNLGGLSTNIASSSFGQLTSATARTIQIGAKLIF